MEIISSYELNNELWVDQTDSEVQASKECAKRTITDLLSPTSSVILDTYEVEPNSMEYTSEAHSNTTRYESDEEFKAKPTVLETLLKSKGLKDDKKSRETVVSPINRSINRQQLVSPSNQDFKLINSVVEDSPRRSLSFNDAAHLKEQIKISLDTKVEKCDIRSNTTPLIEKEEVDPTTLIKSKDITEANSNNLVNKKSKEALINPALKRVESPTSAQVDVEEEEIKSPILDETVSKNFKDSRPYDASQGFESFSFSQPTEDDFKPYLKGESILDFESASRHKDLRYRSEVNQEDLNLESGKEIRLQKVDGRNSSDNIIRENIGRLVNEKEIGTVDKSQGSSKDPLNENKVNKFNLENVASSDRKRMGYSMKEGDKKGIIAERIKMFGSEINIKTSTMSKSQPNKESVNFKARPWSPDNNTLSSKINYDGKHSKSDLTLESKVKVNRNKFLENNSSDNINESALKSLIGTVKGWEPELQDQMNKTSSISKGSNNVNKISPLNGSTNETKNHLDQKDLTKETTVGKVKTWEPTTLKSETKIKEDTINNHTMKQKANQSEDCNEVAKVESEVNILTCIEKTNANLSLTTEDSSNIVNPSGILVNMSNPELNMISNSIKNTTNEVSEVKLVKNTNKSNEAVKLPPVGLRRHGATYSKDELVIDRNLLTASKIHQEIGLVDSKKEGPAIIKEATDLDFNSILAEYNNMKISKSPQKIRTTESLGQSLLSTRSDSLKPSQVNNSFVEGRNKNPSYQTRAKSPNRPRCVSPSKGFETIHNEKESKDQQNGQQIEKHDSSENINVADFKLNNIIENNNRNSPSQSYNPKVESVIKENDVEARSSYLNPKSLEPSLSAVLQCIKYLDEKDFENHRYSSALTIYSTMMGSESTDSSPNLEAHIPYPSDNNSIEDLVLNSKQHESPKQRVQSTARKEDYQFPPNNTKQPRISTTLSAFSLPEKKEDISVSPSEASCRSEPLFSHHRKPSSVFTPAPPPKSNLRVNRPHKLIENKGAGSVPPTIKLKSKSLNRKLSDPEMFTMSAMSRNDKNRPNINHNRNYSSRTNDSIGTNGPPLASPSLSLPQRFESLESLRSHSEEMISKSNSESKLIHVVEELISTEVSYREDLILLRDIYMKAAKENPNEFSVKDIHIIFINVEDIIDYSRKLIQLFKINSQEIATLMIGKVIIEEQPSRSIFTIF
ncbi:hypothetical protein K502DRAFT_82270 [Neoconidiobolus thromboides FSU 785]|nr:hypothetical protein K502DRAFT_82270 [Neoconidiobolus thromboides FSU 785]